MAVLRDHNVVVSVVPWLTTTCHRHRIDCLLAIGLELVAVAVTEQSLLSGSKALTVATYGLVPVYKNQYAISLSGFVPR